jgi:hypothetical protein
MCCVAVTFDFVTAISRADTSHCELREAMCRRTPVGRTRGLFGLMASCVVSSHPDKPQGKPPPVKDLLISCFGVIHLPCRLGMKKDQIANL